MMEVPRGIVEEMVLSFARGHRLQHDRVRDVWIVQAPEKAFVIEGAAPHILRLLDGKRSVGDIIQQLAQEFSAPREVIAKDVLTLLSELTEKNVLHT
ncbi:MAG: pyrroloquinoline quinone biosynthesis peptide chaperone PqqD [Gluconobacter potus]|uniref:PqqA binding protein n=1 Tax=Gluconobacter potus TaxID=2724927 RepID=A0ABR9YN16_9PROT|nr:MULTISPECIES: pyrroloquinoline quinone biosynthesis peptide chaperone PqqD [Gluconobacter]MBF0864859.1 pyrroloquinoline quinone biosynthesis peptide chaperone PqqD [Gluconobacter sp. R71656]MBF0868014.1 pyrroloquinoline quinone biosynthesis peptide chaperone PqqD [Gluconobacter sp. R75628]MBF0873996.1 pyrroloquinoline quinone biosynthesis peptide chaperone PqqD [Gluconobacter sp. R75629]MBF0882973.1 pyrroloquinoline quinone biosynthesis peptide chaperone PqqD [Gluconobacter potus]